MGYPCDRCGRFSLVVRNSMDCTLRTTNLNGLHDQYDEPEWTATIKTKESRKTTHAARGHVQSFLVSPAAPTTTLVLWRVGGWDLRDLTRALPGFGVRNPKPEDQKSKSEKPSPTPIFNVPYPSSLTLSETRKSDRKHAPISRRNRRSQFPLRSCSLTCFTWSTPKPKP